MLEGAAGHVEVPLGAVLRLPALGQPAEAGIVGDADGLALDHEVEAIVSVFVPVRRLHRGWWARFFAFCRRARC